MSTKLRNGADGLFSYRCDIEIRNIQVYLDEKDMIGRVYVTINGLKFTLIIYDGSKEDGGPRVAWPRMRTKSGAGSYPVIWPVDDEFRDTIEKEVLAEFRLKRISAWCKKHKKTIPGIADR